jgi:hypothetical protein
MEEVVGHGYLKRTRRRTVALNGLGYELIVLVAYNSGGTNERKVVTALSVSQNILLGLCTPGDRRVPKSIANGAGADHRRTRVLC